MKTEKSYNQIEVPGDLEAKLSKLIDRLDAEEKRSKRNVNLYRISGIAACVAVLLSIGFFYSPKNTPDNTLTANNHIVITDPETASIEAEKALILVATNFNKGMKQLDILTENLEKTHNILNKTFKN